MRVTLRDIAEEAGVSLMTVSNVVNGKSARVSPQTIERVQRILIDRGYVANASARSLAAKFSRVVGLLVPAAEDDNLLVSPHNVAILGAIEHRVRQRGYHLLVRGIVTLDEVSEAVRAWNLDGLLLVGLLDEDIDSLNGLGTTPIVAVDSYAENPFTVGVRPDDFEGGRLAAALLIEHGHREILFASPPFGRVGVVRERFDGFSRAFADAGLPAPRLTVNTGSTSFDAGIAEGRELRKRHPSATAVFATADALAVGIMEGLAESGARVPDDVSVVGFDDLEIGRLVRPKLTTIAQDITQKGLRAADMLLDSIERQEHPNEPVVIPVHVVERDSVIRIA